MERDFERYAIICTADVAPAAIERFTTAVREHDARFDDQLDDPVDVEECFALIHTQALSSIQKGLSTPVLPFTSPFIGNSVDEATAWFITNISKPNTPGYHPFIFFIFDNKFVEEQVCTLVCTSDEPATKVQCTADMAYDMACCVDNERTMLRSLGIFVKSGELISDRSWKLVTDRGMYLDGMEVLYDEYWTDLIQKYLGQK